MTTEYEYYETGDAQVTQVYGVNWYAQTFTVGASAHTITNVKLKLYRSGLPGTVTVSIRATSGNHPTGSDLTSGTIDGNTITDASPGQFYEIAVTELALSANTKYAVVVRAPSGTDAKYVCWRQNNTGGYSGGNKEESNDSGAGWTSWTAIDFMFEVWGNGVATPISASDSGTGSDTASIGLSVADSGVGTESAPLIGPLGTDAGVGAEAATTSATMTVTDAGAGVESPGVEASVPSSDSGVGAESSLDVQNQLTETDAGLGSESPGISASVPVSESGAGLDAPGVEASIPISDAAVGSESVTPSSSFTVADFGVLSNETVTTPGTLTVSDEGKGAEFAWRTKPSSPMIDALVLPHVLSIKISDPATMSDKKVQGGSLPRRNMAGKPGRVVEVDGWSDSQTEIDALEALRDGVRRTFYHPNGDSFGVLVTDFQPSRTVDQYDRRTYRLALAEAN